MNNYEPELNRIYQVFATSEEYMPEGPHQWIYNTMVAYRRAVLDKGRVSKSGVLVKHHATNPRFRRGFIESYLAFKRFYLDNKDSSLGAVASISVDGDSPTVLRIPEEEIEEWENWFNEKEC